MNERKRNAQSNSVAPAKSKLFAAKLILGFVQRVQRLVLDEDHTTPAQRSL
jgi:hypothetical protein